jgi:hypothetical protein
MRAQCPMDGPDGTVNALALLPAFGPGQLLGEPIEGGLIDASELAGHQRQQDPLDARSAHEREGERHVRAVGALFAEPELAGRYPSALGGSAALENPDGCSRRAAAEVVVRALVVGMPSTIPPGLGRHIEGRPYT